MFTEMKELQRSGNTNFADRRWFSFSLCFSAFSKFSTKTDGAFKKRSIHRYVDWLYLSPVFHFKQLLCFYTGQDHSTFPGIYIGFLSPNSKTFVSDLGFSYLGIHVRVRPFYIELKFRSLLLTLL